jgi:hypothetical protein
MKLIKITALLATFAGTVLATSCGQQQQNQPQPGYQAPSYSTGK